MSLRNWLHPPKPCQKCPYKLGMIKTLVNPCPACKESGYLVFAGFRKTQAGVSEKPAEKD